MSNVFDLDTLAPQKATVKFNGEEIAVSPPSTEDLFTLGTLGQKLQDVTGDDLEALASAIKEMREYIDVVVPELKGAKLNIEQMMGLLDFIIDFSTPSDTKALKEKGITPANAKDSDPKAA